MYTFRIFFATILLFSLSLSTTSSSAQDPVQTLMGITERISVASDGTQGNSHSYFPSISADGRYVAFESMASNLVDGDTNNICDTDDDQVFDDNCPDVFVHDRVTGETIIASVASDGTHGNYWSEYPSISTDGCYVAFDSGSTNLIAGDTNWEYDVFVHDLVTGETTRVSVASDGTEGNSDSDWPSISGDVRYVSFCASASNLVDGDTNGVYDIFVHDRVTGETTRVSVASDGTQGNGDSIRSYISADGRYVAFYSYADNLVDGDTNGLLDVFVHDQVTGETRRVSVASDGRQANGDSGYSSISADGAYVAFDSSASNLVDDDTNGYDDVFMHDRVMGETQRISIPCNGAQGNENSMWPSISADGRYVAFFSWASNLVNGDTNGFTDTFVHDRVTGETTRVSVASDGTEGNLDSVIPSISADGHYVAFDSMATNLVEGDTN